MDNFILISGFLVGLSGIGPLEYTESKVKNVRIFVVKMMKRWLRLFPVLCAALFLESFSALLTETGLYGKNETYKRPCPEIFTYLNHLFLWFIGAGTHCSYAHLWYISVDIFNYLLVLLYETEKSLNKSIISRAFWILISVSWTVGLITSCWLEFIEYDKNDKFTYSNVLYRSSQYMLAYFTAKNLNVLKTKLKILPLKTTLSAVTIIVYFLSPVELGGKQGSFYTRYAYSLAFLLFIVSMLSESQTLTPVTNILGNRIFSLLSKFSYSVYVIHMLAVDFVVSEYDNYPFSQKALLSVVGAFLLGFLLTLFIEIPFGNINKTIRPKYDRIAEVKEIIQV